MGKRAFGEQNPTQGETAVSWQTWSNGEGGAPTITGDADWGKLHLDDAKEGRSAVYDLGSAASRTFTLEENHYGTGSGSMTLQIRGDTSSFLQDDTLPVWETYLAPITRGWRYVQIRETANPFLGGIRGPLQADPATHRYLVDGIGKPFLMIGDSPQGLMANCTPAQMATYFANRAGYGFNAVQVHLLAGATFGGNSTTFQAQDGTHAFTVDGDISTPNSDYFAQVDAMLNLANSYGFVVFLTAAEWIDGETMWQANGVTKCTNFGAYLGSRYKNFLNIVWNFGNDFNDHVNPTDNALLLAVCDGIKDNDLNHLHTAWLGGIPQSDSRSDSDWNTRVDLNMGYTYSPTYDITLIGYARSPAKPIYLGEANYEGESLRGYESTSYIIRKQNYWTMLSGSCGLFYCNEDIWGFASGWATRLDSFDGPTELIHLRNLFEAYNWWLMIPDDTHDVLTAGYGTYSTDDDDIDTNDYATCAYLADGSLAMIYMPTSRAMTVDMSQFNGTVTCRWFDPTDGSYIADAASPHVNSGTHDFSRATTNSAGASDWVLVLET